MNLTSLYHSDIPFFLQEFSLTPPMDRLKGIGMDCGCEYTNFPAYRHSINSSRYEHSICTALIIWHFTSDIAQTIAGLFHDISTPVFSHTIDFLNKDHLAQESTEHGTQEIICQSQQIQTLLNKYKIPSNNVCNYHLYPIADNASPRLSADRLEYTLRKFVCLGIKTTDELSAIYSDLVVDKNEDDEDEIMFSDCETAIDFSLASLINSRNDISDEDRFAMQFLADLLETALKKGILQFSDLYTTENYVINKLNQHSETALLWNKLRLFSEILKASEKPRDNHWFRIPAKKRYINPYVRSHGRADTLSESLKQEIQSYLDIDLNDWITAQGETT